MKFLSHRPFCRWNMVLWSFTEVFRLLILFFGSWSHKLHFFRNIFSYVHQYCCQISCLLVEYYWRYWALQLSLKHAFTGSFWTLLYFDAQYLYSDLIKWETTPYFDWLVLIKKFQVSSQSVFYVIRLKCFLRPAFLFLVGFP